MPTPKKRNPPAMGLGAAQLSLLGAKPTDVLFVSHGRTMYPRQGPKAGKRVVIYTGFKECIYHWACRGICNWQYANCNDHKRWKNGDFDIDTDMDLHWPNTRKTVKYHLTITNGTGAPDGFERPILLINGQTPGPVSASTTTCLLPYSHVIDHPGRLGR